MSDTSTAVSGVTRKRVLIESQVIIEPGATPCNWRTMTNDERQTWLERWARELMEFFRDHRHQDVNSVYVDPTYQQQCSGCGAEWETMIDNETNETCCASCGTIVTPTK